MASRGRRIAFLALGLLALGIGGGVGLGVAEAPATAPAAQSIEGPGTFGTCAAKTTVVTATINRSTLRRGQSLTVALSATNEANTACKYAGVRGRAVASVGPCGATPLVILNPQGDDVWPGNVFAFCPLETDRILHPGQTVRARGRWNVTAANGSAVGPGSYTVDVAIWIRLAVVVVG